MGSVEQVERAIQMRGPDYVPILFFNRDKEQSDIILIDVVRHFMGENADLSEWGFQWGRHDETMGQPKEELIKGWEDFDRLKIPDAADSRRFSQVADIQKQYADKYYVASLVLTGFTIMTFLRGFAALLEDFYENTEEVERLADAVFGFEEDIIRQLKAYGFHGVAFYDDWGTQTNLIISPKMWREFFKPRYKRQFDLAHQYGMDVYFHCCGYIYDIIPDLIEIGVDMLNISQPNLFDIEKMGKDFGGKVCFVCPISYQTTAISGTKEDIDREAERLIKNLGSYNGGLIGYVEEYHTIGMSEENYQSCVSAFRELGKYR
ncbi:MAG: uroporphyrinogen decarboxylase family protein [Clostridia bacterium]|nr:uroporphyrinogen decarboxylase family protein [Clostridia bacterium]